MNKYMPDLPAAPRAYKREDYQAWFAWRPVWTTSGWRWLTYVVRTWYGSYAGGWWGYETIQVHTARMLCRRP